MKYGVEQKIFMYDAFVQHSSWRKCHRKSRRKYSDSTVPHKVFFYYYWWGGTKSLGTAATSGLLYKPQMIDEDDCGAVGGMKIGRGN
jgi:hypothetical protein